MDDVPQPRCAPIPFRDIGVNPVQPGSAGGGGVGGVAAPATAWAATISMAGMRAFHRALQRCRDMTVRVAWKATISGSNPYHGVVTDRTKNRCAAPCSQPGRVPPACPGARFSRCTAQALVALALAAAVIATVVPLAACVRTAAPLAVGAAPARAELVVRRGDFSGRMVLTGELRAVRAEEIIVPRFAGWGAQIRWLAADGVPVAAGARVLDIDASNIASTLEERRLAVLTAQEELTRQEAQNTLDLEARSFALEQRRTALAKAEIEADVPVELMSRRDWEDRQIAVERARVEFDKARDEVEAARRAAQADRNVRTITLTTVRRLLAQAQESLASLSIIAPRAGLILIGDHPWEGRKFQVGDTTFPGATVLRIPDLQAMEAEAALFDVDDGAIAVGARARCTLDAYPDQSVAGTLTTIAPIAQEAARNSLRRSFRVTVALASTDPERMRPGMSVKIEVATADLSNVLLAPRIAIDRDGPAPRARLRGGRAVAVELGPCSNQECVIASGLAEGEKLRAFAAGAR